MCITPEVKLCVGLRNQDRAMATAQNPTLINSILSQSWLKMFIRSAIKKIYAKYSSGGTTLWKKFVLYFPLLLLLSTKLAQSLLFVFVLCFVFFNFWSAIKMQIWKFQKLKNTKHKTKYEKHLWPNIVFSLLHYLFQL